MENTKIAVIGGDRRMLFCAKAFLSDGYDVSVTGFDNLCENIAVKKLPLEKNIILCDKVVLPLPCIKGEKIFAPYSENDIKCTEYLSALLNEKTVYTSMKEKLLENFPALKEENVFDYSSREDFAIQNAVPTAEGALSIAIDNFEGTIFRSRCLVCGFGKIGKVLSKRLYDMGADVTVSARKQSDLSYIETQEYNAVNTYEIKRELPFDIIFNTVPALVFDAKTLKMIARNALVIDLASLPGGVDFEAASLYDIKAIQALSLPGKYAPKFAGEVIKNTIINMFKEETG
ncbi:MAG: dipicolinate synthase subunit DpsA [Oscillospiraceae bacterium]|nr:dipicolinate synthase subunit DpsA [Candidatus Ruminococcus equi]